MGVFSSDSNFKICISFGLVLVVFWSGFIHQGTRETKEDEAVALHYPPKYEPIDIALQKHKTQVDAIKKEIKGIDDSQVISTVEEMVDLGIWSRDYAADLLLNLSEAKLQSKLKLRRGWYVLAG